MSQKLACDSKNRMTLIRHKCSSLRTNAISALILISILNTSCGNVFTDVSSQNSDQVILYDVNRAVSSGLWTQAISKIALLSTTTRTLRSTQVLLSSAYAGRCGLNIIALANAVQTNTSSSSSLFLTIKAGFLGSLAAQESDCIYAQTILQAAWGQLTPSSSFSPIENFLMAFIGISELGTIINRWGDPSATGTVIWKRPLNNDPCDATNGDTALPIAELNQMVLGVSLMMQGLIAVGTAQLGSLASIAALCTGSGQLVATGICGINSTTQVTAAMRLAMRGLLEETTNAIGLQIYNGDFSAAVSTCGDTN